MYEEIFCRAKTNFAASVMLVAKKWVPLNHSADFQSPDSLSEPSEIHLVFPRLWSIIIHQFCFCEIRSSMWFDSLGNVVVWSTKFTNWGAAGWIRNVYRGGGRSSARWQIIYCVRNSTQITCNYSMPYSLSKASFFFKTWYSHFAFDQYV